ncbi:MAG: hypothetical protein MJE77_11825 [Proteobacteria bacterium]|nr:hypothetical protein [Pseudomonadota bacterium]
MKHVQVLSLIGLGLLTADGASWAQSPQPVGHADLGWPDNCGSINKRQAARQRFLAGNQLLRNGLHARAVTTYKEALGLCEHPAFYYNLAVAQIALDQYLEAHGSLTMGAAGAYVAGGMAVAAGLLGMYLNRPKLPHNRKHSTQATILSHAAPSGVRFTVKLGF